MRIHDLPTPALILDRAVVARNTERMAARVAGTGVRLRPHMKTAKSARVAELATAGQFGGITVSTLAEARYFAAAGIRDLTYAVGMVPGKLAEAAAIQRDGARLTLLTDDPGAATALADKASELGERFDVLVEIDSGGHRGGVAPEAPELLAIARILDEAENLNLAGVLTHAGHSYHCQGVAEVKAVAEQERQAAVRAAARLGEAGLPCLTVSAGSTPTALHAESFEGLTEIRPGVYMLFDLDQVGLGSCAVEDIGISVLASVIGHQRPHNRINIDAGSLALSQDRSAEEFLPDVGYGWVMAPDGRTRIGDLHVAAVNQEHGMVAGASPLPFDALPVGARVRVLPNHACITAAAYDRYHVVDGGDEVIDVWDRVNGW
ncbi:MAG: alanine racemase [Alphaproteobacteria bacterium]|nr:alanine racemase [Alphaproteobacteria bacterium]